MIARKPAFVLTALGAVAAAFIAAPTIAAPSSIAGKWKTGDGKAIVTIAPCGQSLCGRITKFLVPEPPGGARDGKNPDSSQRDRMLLGSAILWNLKPKGSAFSGNGYSPEAGRNFNATVTRSGNGLKVKGCVLLFCQSQNWTKV